VGIDIVSLDFSGRLPIDKRTIFWYNSVKKVKEEPKMKCSECGREFTKDDEYNANFSEYMGKYSHRMCPGMSCKICGEEIADFAKAKKGAGGQGWQHKSCKPATIRTSQAGREAKLRDEEAQDRGWIRRYQ
jgi:hypothetical protein